MTHDDEEIYFECWGEGETVVLCHGMGGNHMVWYQQVPVLAERYRVVTWDQRGFGRSSNRTGRFGPDESVGDLAAVLDHLGVGAAHVIGQSMGGWAALGWAVTHPSRTLSLVLADTVGGVITDDIRTALASLGESITAGPSPAELDLGSHPAVGSQLTEQDLAKSFLYTQIGGMTAPPPPGAVVEILNSTDHTQGARETRVPVLLIVGSDDDLFPPHLIRQAGEVFPNSQVVEVEGTGHSPYFELPEVWNEVVGDFLDSVSSAS